MPKTPLHDLLQRIQEPVRERKGFYLVPTSATAAASLIHDRLLDRDGDGKVQLDRERLVGLSKLLADNDKDASALYAQLERAFDDYRAFREGHTSPDIEAIV